MRAALEIEDATAKLLSDELHKGILAACMQPAK